MTPEQTVLVEGPESLANLCLHLRRMSDSQGDQIDADRLSHCADLIEAQAAELERLREALTELRDLMCEGFEDDDGNSGCGQCENDCTGCIADRALKGGA